MFFIGGGLLIEKHYTAMTPILLITFLVIQHVFKKSYFKLLADCPKRPPNKKAHVTPRLKKKKWHFWGIIF